MVLSDEEDARLWPRQSRIRLTDNIDSVNGLTLEAVELRRIRMSLVVC